MDDNVAAYLKAKLAHAEDLKPNLDAIEKRGSDAFVTVTNRSNGQKYQLCASDSGWIWAYTVTVDHADAKPMPTVCIGCFSKNAKFMGISTSTLDNLALVIISLVLVRPIALRAITVAVEKLVNVFSSASSAGVFQLGSWGINCLDVGVSVGTLFLFSTLYKPFGLEVNIYNWDEEEQWDIVEWHPDNAVILNNRDEKKVFEQANLRPISSTFLMSSSVMVFRAYEFFPDQIPMPMPVDFIVSDQPAATYATYVIQNGKFS